MIELRAGGEAAAVMVSSLGVAQITTVSTGLVSLGVGLVGVWLARWVFVGRENRHLGKPQRWNDTLPLTLVAMLITGAVIYDRHLGISAAAFVGLGVGWAAVLILDILGERILSALRAGFAVPLPKHVEEQLDRSGHRGQIVDETDLPADMIENLRKLDREI